MAVIPHTFVYKLLDGKRLEVDIRVDDVYNNGSYIDFTILDSRIVDTIRESNHRLLRAGPQANWSHDCPAQNGERISQPRPRSCPFCRRIP